MDITARLHYTRIAPRKIRLVANLMKGLDVKDAGAVLTHTRKRSSDILHKLLKSAVANASHNFQLKGQGLYVRDVVVQSGPVLKRTMPRAFGRAAMIRKRMSHVILVLSSREAGGVSHSSPRHAAETPVLRDATAADIHGEVVAERPEKPGLKKKVTSRTPLGFIKKIINRKTI